ncbi:hypothetical protein KXD40_000751 [Peronospora effusa]|uniref:C2H2-type domain-containing protein n=1 Tax=Peronospora effusa TaxID=542832 RepID=A0A3M6VVD2_9STRA|nr:hypothetical protein DD238_001053 [Peronospora effusa]RQM17910.1 hypothetical protein DD237_002232 [Peronospora effusa]UIZ21146.1 hypothetical protein KXD40_000751 [Peronospora effusa]CAI5705816.1 unnamed protein product [Peronospora effusa]
MQRRELREVLSLLQRLNDCVSISARRMYTQQVTLTEMLQCSLSDTRRLLPELCLFVDSLLPRTFTSNNKSIGAPPSSLVRHAFRHPEAQWLSRSARQSGISALLCQQLVRLARQDSDSGVQDHNKTIYSSAAELIMHILLDALLSPCAQRLGQAPDACRWNPLQHKPRFHAMTCFPVWSSLLPFAAMIGIQFPDVFQQVMKEHRCLERTIHRVNCDFALVTGIWRLVEELDRGDKEKQRAVSDVIASLLSFASDRMLLCCKNVKDDKKSVHSHLDDQLLEKFFTGMQKFSFKSRRADEILKQTIFGTLQEALGRTECGSQIGAVPQRVVVFTTAGCMLVKDLAVDIVSMVMKQINDLDTLSDRGQHPLLTFLVGFCAHVDLVRLPSVLEVLKMLVTSYKAAAHHAVNPEHQRQWQRELVFYIVYVTLLRSESVDSLRQEVSSDAAAILELLKQFQMQLCSEIAYEDFQFAAPVHWMARVWKHWVFLSDEDVQSFVSEAQENDTDTEQEFKKRMTTWQAWKALIAFKLPSFSRFPQMKSLVNPHLLSLPLADLNDEHGLIIRGQKRRRTEKLSTTNNNPEQLERSFDVLLLPDVMERVCSFMSAKRLCRMTLVCRDFAKLSHSASLWRQLYLRIGSPIGKKQSVVPASPVECRHGDSYKHNWRQMYQERWIVLRRLRRMQRRAIEAVQSSGEAFSSNNRIATFIPQMCTYCGCNQVFKSASEHNVHEAKHKRFTCTEFSCQASFIGLHKFNQHMKEHATKSIVPSTTTCRLVCGYNGCKKRYMSAKRMTTHRQKANHFDRRKA